MKKQTIPLILSTSLLLTLGGCATTAEVGDVVVAPLLVRTVSPVVENFFTTATSVATLEPSSRVAVLAGVSGEVEQFYVALGDTVSNGQVLCVVDSKSARDMCETAENNVVRAQEGIDVLLETMLVTAPVSGYVQSIEEKLEHSVTSSSQLAYLANQKQMTVKLPFLDSLVDSSWIGDKASLNFTDTGESLTGYVTEISGSPDYLYGTISVNYVTITVDNPGGVTVGRHVAGSVNGVTCSADGAFSSEASSPVFSGLNGTIDTIYVSVGDYVQAGAPLFRITSASVENSLQSARNSLSDAIDAREDAYDALADYQVRANISGTVSNVYTKRLDMVSPTSAIIEISTTDRLELSFTVTESVLPYLSVGQELGVTAQGQLVRGVIREIAKVANGQTGLFTIVGEVDDDSVLSGTSAQVEYIDFMATDALLIPFEAVHFIGESSYVFLVEDGVALQQEIEIAQFTDEQVVVVSGLSLSDTLISTWSTQLRTGLAVQEEAGNVSD